MYRLVQEELLAELVEDWDGCVEESVNGGTFGTITFHTPAGITVTSESLELIDLETLEPVVSLDASDFRR